MYIYFFLILYFSVYFLFASFKTRMNVMFCSGITYKSLCFSGARANLHYLQPHN
jgi:hypothetical protein